MCVYLQTISFSEALNRVTKFNRLFRFGVAGKWEIGLRPAGAVQYFVGRSAGSGGSNRATKPRFNYSLRPSPLKLATKKMDEKVALQIEQGGNVDRELNLVQVKGRPRSKSWCDVLLAAILALGLAVSF